MITIKFANWEVEVDTNATRATYALLIEGGPEECGCLYCRNYVAARTLAYSKEALELFNQLGINSNREAEIFYLSSLPSGLHSYGGWFHFIGTVVTGINAERPIGKNVSTFDFVPFGEHFQIGLIFDAQLVPEAFKGYPILQLEFLTEIPWVINDPPEE